MLRKWLFRISSVLLLPLIAACAQQPTTEPAIPETGNIGTITQILNIVEIGPKEDELEPVGTTKQIRDGDLLEVTKGGEGLLDFGDFLRMRLFNDTAVQTIRTESAEDISFFARIRLEAGGFTGDLIKEGSSVEFETPNGGVITVKGTQFWVVYDEDSDTLGVGNFDGSISLSIGVDQVAISPAHYVIVPSGQPPNTERPMRMTFDEFNQDARDLQSPVEVMMGLIQPAPSETPTETATDTPVPATETRTITPSPTNTPTRTNTPTPTYTRTFTPTPTPACPPVIQVAQDANCREGPGTIWQPVTVFNAGTLLIPNGYASFQSLWWNVRIPASRRSCWISDSVINLYGETSCLSRLQIPPTYTPTPTDTPTYAPVTTLPPAPAEITGRVYKDLNFNKKFDSGEGYGGVNVTLGKGSCSSTGYGSINTGGNGRFRFSNLPAGTYCVTVQITETCGAYSIPINNRRRTVTIAPGESFNAGRFGFSKYIC